MLRTISREAPLVLAARAASICVYLSRNDSGTNISQWRVRFGMSSIQTRMESFGDYTPPPRLPAFEPSKAIKEVLVYKPSIEP